MSPVICLKGPVSSPCAAEVKRIMLNRAKSVDLNPEVEDACMSDLGIYCSDKEKKTDVCLNTHRVFM